MTSKQGLDKKRFYLGANTPSGFVSYFNTVGSCKDGWHRFLIKGGPGTGKSSLMKKLARELAEDMELIYCSSDQKSLDGVVFPEKKIMIVDATAPHILEPVYPGAYDKIVSLYESFNYNMLRKNRSVIEALSKENLFYQNQAVNVLSSANGLIRNNSDVLERYVQAEKVDKYINMFFEREFQSCSECAEGCLESERFLTAVNQEDKESYINTVKSIADKVYVIKDDFGIVSGKVLSAVREKLISLKIKFITCCCVIFSGDKIDHILIPDKRMAVVTSNKYHDFSELECKEILDCRDFLNDIDEYFVDKVSENLIKISDIICYAKELIAKAKAIHESLEQYYIEAVDFSLVDREAQKVMDMIKDIIIAR